MASGSGHVAGPDPGDVLAELAGDDIAEVLRRLGATLRALHDTDAEGCPWRCGPAELVATAAARERSGAVDPTRFDLPYRRYSSAQLLDLAERSVPEAPTTPTVIHGAARLRALRIDDGALVWVDAGACGLGDPYRDLATMAVDLASAIGPEALAPFLDAYGVDHPDVIRMDWHVLADQLLR